MTLCQVRTRVTKVIQIYLFISDIFAVKTCRRFHCKQSYYLKDMAMDDVTNYAIALEISIEVSNHKTIR